ncbi:hypothetical protein ELI_3458 [Eubacterium callanderi]|uniref:Uncharacterized protein n=1 Tax=Eubacterium callanderi TaxID=53442 RepID=E3GFT3_9FIRM|nr:hypothetical protein ELI_3458 [Eubacterium callanderi]
MIRTLLSFSNIFSPPQRLQHNDRLPFCKTNDFYPAGQ